MLFLLCVSVPERESKIIQSFSVKLNEEEMSFGKLDDPKIMFLLKQIKESRLT